MTTEEQQAIDEEFRLAVSVVVNPRRPLDLVAVCDRFACGLFVLASPQAQRFAQRVGWRSPDQRWSSS